MHTGGAQQFGGVGGDVAGGQHIQIGDLAGLDGLIQQIGLEQHVAQAGFGGHLKQTGQLGTAQVAVDDQHLVIHLGKGDSQIDSSDTFALGLHGGGDHNDFAALLVSQREHHVGTQCLIGLADKEVASVAQNVLALLLDAADLFHRLSA